MAELHAFFDRDVYVKLACCDIWEDTLEALGITHPYRMASAGSKGCRSVLRRKNVDDTVKDAAMARLEGMASTVPVMPEAWVKAAVTDQLYGKLLDTDGIDQGEAELALIALYCESDQKLVSGDKRFMKAMGEAFPTEFEKLKPTLVSFEQCLLAVTSLRGLEAIRARLLAAKGCDGSLAIALGADGSVDEENFRQALNSFSQI